MPKLLDYVDKPLWPIVCRVDGRDEEQRRARVASWQTTLSIAGGLRQLTKAFGRPLVADLADPAHAPDCRIRSVLTRQAIVDAVNQCWPSELLNAGYLVRTWPGHNMFLADLFSYGLFRQHWSLRVIDETVARLEQAPDFARAVRDAAHRVHEQILENDLYRFHLVAAAYADSDPVIAKALSHTLHLIAERWAGEVYEKLAAARGMRLRPGISIERLALQFQIADQGYGWRTLAMPTEPQCPGPKECTLGEHLLSIIIGLFDSGDGMSIDDKVNSLGGAG